MRDGELQEVKIETFDVCLVNAYDAGTTYFAMFVITLVLARTMTSV